MTTTINASTSTGLVSTADTSGIIKLQSNGVTTNALAWVNFNGTGTVAIRSSYNVSSITDNGTGDYTLNFTTALSDANYSVAGLTIGNSVGNTTRTVVIAGVEATGANLKSTTQLRIQTGQTTATVLADMAEINIIIFGN
jgi:hypothetical protein